MPGVQIRGYFGYALPAMKLLVLALVSMSTGISGLHGVAGPTARQLHDEAHGLKACSGGACKVCTDCSRCKYCKKGGKCSVCK